MPVPLRTPPEVAARWVAWGAEIARVRHAAGLTQGRFAASLGVSEASVRSWEQGIRGASLSLRRRIVAESGADPAILDTALDACPCCHRPFEVNSRAKGRPR